MPAAGSLLSRFSRFATAHPIMASAPVLMGGYVAGARAAGPDDPRRQGHGAAVGALLAGAGLLAVPGLRKAFLNFLRRQGHALTGHVAKGAKLDAEVAKSLKAAKISKRGLSDAEKYWLSSLSHSSRTNPQEIARELTKYRSGTVTLPQLLQGMRHDPVGTIRRGWSHMDPKEKLITLGMGGYGISSALKERDPGEQAGGIAENLAFLATPAAPIGVWLPMSWAAHRLAAAVAGKKKGEQQIPIPYKRPVARYGSRLV